MRDLSKGVPNVENIEFDDSDTSTMTAVILPVPTRENNNKEVEGKSGRGRTHTHSHTLTPPLFYPSLILFVQLWFQTEAPFNAAKFKVKVTYPAEYPFKPPSVRWHFLCQRLVLLTFCFPCSSLHTHSHTHTLTHTHTHSLSLCAHPRVCVTSGSVCDANLPPKRQRERH